MFPRYGLCLRSNIVALFRKTALFGNRAVLRKEVVIKKSCALRYFPELRPVLLDPTSIAETQIKLIEVLGLINTSVNFEGDSKT